MSAQSANPLDRPSANPPGDPPGKSSANARAPGGLRGRLTLIFGLLLLWIVLWGSVSPVVLLFGLLVATGAALMCPVPTTQLVLIRPGRLLAFGARTAVHLIGSGATVAWEAVRHGPRTRSAVVAVPLQMDTDRLVRGAVQLVGLSPGSLVIEIDRERWVLYVHSQPVWDAAETEKRRAEILAAESDILRAFGNSDSGNGGSNGGSNGGASKDSSPHDFGSGPPDRTGREDRS